jgi:hypothetical protein
LKAQRPFVSGFNFLIGYNYNRAKNDEYYDGVDTFLDNLTLQDAPNNRHKFNIGGIYELAVRQGRKFGSSMNKVVNAVFGGWATSGIFQHVSGSICACQARSCPGIPSSTINPRQMVRYIEGDAPPDFHPARQPASVARVGRPRITSLDVTLGKDFKITERVGFEIKLESYNLPNIFNGANPNMTVDNSQFGRVNAQRNTYYGRQFQYTGRIRW